MICRISSIILVFCLVLIVSGEGWAAIARVQNGITTHDGATNFTRATASNVTAGSLLVISAARWRSSNKTLYVAGNLTKSAGTATIDTPVLEYSAAPGSPATSQVVGQWSVLVTGSGTLTLQVANGGTSYGSIAVVEYSGTWDGTRREAANSSTGTTNPAGSGNATSAGAAVFVGSYTSDSGSNTAITQDAAFTLLGEDEAGSDRIEHSFIDRIVSTGTTDAADWTISDAGWVAGVVVYKEGTGGGGGGGARNFMLMGIGQ